MGVQRCGEIWTYVAHVVSHTVYNFHFLSGPLQVSTKQLAGSCERDFFRWVKLPIPVYTATVPVRLDATTSSELDGRGTLNISVVLPSDHLQALHAQGYEVLLHPSFQSFLTMFLLNHFLFH